MNAEDFGIKMEEVEKIPTSGQGSKKSIVIANDFLSKNIKYAKIEISPASAHGMRQILKREGIPVSVTVRKKEVYLINDTM